MMPFERLVWLNSFAHIQREEKAFDRGRAEIVHSLDDQDRERYEANRKWHLQKFTTPTKKSKTLVEATEACDRIIGTLNGF